MRHKFYFVILLCVALGVLFTFAGPYLSAWMASAAPHPAQQRKLQWFYQQSIFGPLAIPAQPTPALAGYFVPSNLYTVFMTLLGVLFLVQIALLLRRVAICIRANSIQPPPTLNRGWKVILWISLVLWLVGVLATLLPRLVHPFLEAELAKAIGFASGVVGAFIVPYFWLIPSNLFGPSFFAIELLSFRKEGVLPLRSTSSPGTPASGRP